MAAIQDVIIIIYIVSTMSSIAFISSGQPSANPRLVKEAIAMVNIGYTVTVIYCPLSPWADDFDKDLFDKNPGINWIKAGYHFSNDKLILKVIRIRRKLFEFFYKRLPIVPYAAENGIALFSHELKVKAKTVKADLYIAHNLAALPAAMKAAAKWKASYAFDAEDFHRGEDKEGSNKWNLAESIEKKYLPGTTYVSAASPLIRQAYKDIYKTISTITINNVFPISYLQPLPKKRLSSDVFKMFWFSQAIGQNRGIEDVIKAMGLLNNKGIELSLLGNLSKERKKYFLELMLKNNVAQSQVKFLPTVKEEQLPIIAAKHHVGLALEVPEYLNRQYCLTNKIFLYLLAGNAVIFSRTPAQQLFLRENEGIGSLFESGSPGELANVISFYMHNPMVLHAHQLNAHTLAKEKFNWELESKLLISKIIEVLN